MKSVTCPKPLLFLNLPPWEIVANSRTEKEVSWWNSFNFSLTWFSWYVFSNIYVIYTFCIVFCTHKYFGSLLDNYLVQNRYISQICFSSFFRDNDVCNNFWFLFMDTTMELICKHEKLQNWPGKSGENGLLSKK